MRTRTVFLPIFALLLLSLLVLPQRTVAAVMPTAPSWIPSGEYVVFPASPVYETQNWDHILALRAYAAGGGTVVDLWNAPVASHYNALVNALWQDYVLQYELRLICYQIAMNKGGALSARDRSLLAMPHPSNYSGAALSSAARYNLHLWTARTNIKVFPASAGSVEALSFQDHFSSMKYLLGVSGFSTAQVYGHEAMTLFDAETVRQYREMIFVLVNNTYFASPYPVGEGGGYKYLDYAKIVNDRTMVPIRFLAEPLGLSVEWTASSRTVIMRRSDFHISLVIGSQTASVNGRAVMLDTPAFIENDRTYVPLRFVSEQMGATVQWDGEKRLVTVENPRGITISSSNLNQWAVAMGALINESNRDRGFSGAAFGQVSTTPYDAADRSSTEALWYEPPALVRATQSATAESILQSSWNIASRARLIATVLQMTSYGHNDSFFQSVEMLEGLSDAAYKTMLENASAVDSYMLPYTKELFEKWGPRGILCWDLFRMSNLVQWGYDAKYLSLEEALALLEPAVHLLQQNFLTWDEATENFIDGYNWWARNNALSQTPWESEYGKLYLELKKSYPRLFDDTLFQKDVLPVYNLDITDLV